MKKKNLFIYLVFACILFSLSYIRNKKSFVESIYPDKKVRIKVEGEVNNPGAYIVPYGTNIYEALDIAGGAKPKANLELIDLDRELKDGEVLNIGTGM